MPYAVMPMCIRLCDALMCGKVHVEGSVRNHEEQKCGVEGCRDIFRSSHLYC